MACSAARRMRLEAIAPRKTPKVGIVVFGNFGIQLALVGIGSIFNRVDELRLKILTLCCQFRDAFRIDALLIG